MAVNGVEIAVGQIWYAKESAGAMSPRRSTGTSRFLQYEITARSDGTVSRHGQTARGFAEKGWAAKELCDTSGGSTLFSDEGVTSGLYRWVILTTLCAEPAQAKSTPAPAPTAAALLSQAAQHMADRAVTYDKPEGERSMAATVAAFNAHTGRDLTESEGWLFMVNLKIVRDNQRPVAHQDSCEDLVAYGALYGESRLKGGAK